MSTEITSRAAAEQIAAGMLKGRLHEDSEVCPHCGLSLVDQPIPEDLREFYGGRKFFSSLMMQLSLLFDRVLAFSCPYCKTIDVIPGREGMWHEEIAHWARLNQADQTQTAVPDTAQANVPPQDVVVGAIPDGPYINTEVSLENKLCPDCGQRDPNCTCCWFCNGPCECANPAGRFPASRVREV